MPFSRVSLISFMICEFFTPARILLKTGSGQQHKLDEKEPEISNFQEDSHCIRRLVLYSFLIAIYFSIENANYLAYA